MEGKSINLTQSYHSKEIRYILCILAEIMYAYPDI